MGGTYRSGTDMESRTPGPTPDMPGGNNAYILSAFVGVLPFMEQQPLWEEISNTFEVTMGSDTGGFFAPMGPNPNMNLNEHNMTRYDPWLTELPTLRCPSDPGRGFPASGRTNYAFCIGDSVRQTNVGPSNNQGMITNAASQRTRESCRGVFVPRQKTAFRDILDGLANTIMAAEINTDLGDLDITGMITEAPAGGDLRTNPIACRPSIDPLRPRFWAPGTPDASANPDNRRGYKWASGMQGYTGVQTILPPNRENCAWDSNGGGVTDLFDEGVYTAASHHPGGCHVLFSDGAVRFITDSIEAGNSGHGTVRQGGTPMDPQFSTVPGAQSPFGLWGALGTRASKETIDEEL